MMNENDYDKETINRLYDALENASYSLKEATNKILELDCFDPITVLNASIYRIKIECTISKVMAEQDEREKIEGNKNEMSNNI